MAKNYNLTNQEIQNTFEQLAQVSSSIENGVSGYAVTDGTGSKVDLLNVSASYALTASFALNGGGGGTVDTGSLLTTASFDNGTRDMTFTKGDGSTFTTNIPDATVSTGSLLVTSSAVNDTITFTKGDGTTYTNVINNVSASLSTEEIFVTAKNIQGVSIPKGYAVHSAGVTGENVNITTASFLDSSLMPAIGITQTAINAGAAGEVIISGRLKNVNTSNLVAGNPVYVNGEGALTATKPTGSALIQNIGVCAKVNATEGEIIVMGAGRSNDVPNIAPGYAWVGNSDSVATAVTTSSLLVDSASFATNSTSASHALNADDSISASYAVTSSHVTDTNIAYKNQNNVFTGTQTFNNIAVNGTGSFAYLQQITGSAKVIGDAFIILNNDLPAERYAGIKVLDTGSTTNTASLVWDGQTNDWFYEFSSSGTHEYGVVMMGPEYTTQGSPTYLTNKRIPKGTGGHHLEDSNIEDSGTTIIHQVNTRFNDYVDFNTTSDIRMQGFTFISGGYNDLTITSNNVDFEDISSNPLANINQNSISFKKDTTITGSVDITGSLDITGPVNGKFTGSFSGSFDGDLQNAETASYVEPLVQDVHVTGSINLTGSMTVTGAGTAAINNELLDSNFTIKSSANNMFGTGTRRDNINLSGDSSLFRSYSSWWLGITINEYIQGLNDINLAGFNNYQNSIQSRMFDSTGTMGVWDITAPLSKYFVAYSSGSRAFQDYGGFSLFTYPPGYTPPNTSNDFNAAATLSKQPGEGWNNTGFRANYINVGGEMGGVIQIGNTSGIANRRTQNIGMAGDVINFYGTETKLLRSDMSGAKTNNTASIEIGNSGSEGRDFQTLDLAPNSGTNLHIELSPTTAQGIYNQVGTFGRKQVFARNFTLKLYGGTPGNTVTWGDEFSFPENKGWENVPQSGESTYMFEVYSGSLGGVRCINAIKNYQNYNPSTTYYELVDSASYAFTASYVEPLNQELVITGSVRGNVTALSIASQTASIDASVGDYYTLTLVSGSNTHIDSSNILPGKSFMLKTAQPTSATDSHGTITFDPEFKFAGGTAPTATATSGSEDIYTFVAFDSTNVYSTQLGDLK